VVYDCLVGIVFPTVCVLTGVCDCMYHVYRYAKLHVFEKNVLKFVIDWANIRIIDVKFYCCFSVLH